MTTHTRNVRKQFATYSDMAVELKIPKELLRQYILYIRAQERRAHVRPPHCGEGDRVRRPGRERRRVRLQGRGKSKAADHVVQADGHHQTIAGKIVYIRQMIDF